MAGRSSVQFSRFVYLYRIPYMGVTGRNITKTEDTLAYQCVGKSTEQCKAIMSGTTLKYNIYPQGTPAESMRNDLQMYFYQKDGIVTEG